MTDLDINKSTYLDNKSKIDKMFILHCFNRGIPWRKVIKDVSSEKLAEIEKELQAEGKLPIINLNRAILRNFIFDCLKRGQIPINDNQYFSRATVSREIRRMKNLHLIPDHIVDQTYCTIYKMYVKNHTKPWW